MRLCIFGGSFDPVHLGHLALAEACWAQASLDRLLFVPTARQPLKPGGPVASNADRLAMLRLAIAARAGFEASTTEIDRGGVSYTVDTLREVRRQVPEAELFFAIGADALTEFAQWRKPGELLRLATPLVVERAEERDQAHASRQVALANFRPFVDEARLLEIERLKIEMPPTPISSSVIRQLIAGGGEWDSLVPFAVAEFIRGRGLYG